jgi:hypothetical protein
VLNGGIHTYMHTYIHAYTYTYLAHTYIYIYLVQMLVDSKLDLAALGVVLFDLIAALRALKHHNNFMLSSSLKPKPETRNPKPALRAFEHHEQLPTAKLSLNPP